MVILLDSSFDPKCRLHTQSTYRIGYPQFGRKVPSLETERSAVHFLSDKTCHESPAQCQEDFFKGTLETLWFLYKVQMSRAGIESPANL